MPFPFLSGISCGIAATLIKILLLFFLLFLQVLTIHIAFMLLKDAALVLGLTFDPLVIVSDFELAMVQASTMSFPNSYHRGCYYHFKQAIWRKVYAC